MPPQSAAKSLHLAKTVLTRTTATVEQRKSQKPLIVPPTPTSPLSKHLQNNPTPHPQTTQRPHNFSTHNFHGSATWPRSASHGSHGSYSTGAAWPVIARPTTFGAPARHHSDMSAFGRHYGTFSSPFHPPSNVRHTHVPHVHHHHHHTVVRPSIASLTRFALGARAFVGAKLAPEIKRLGIGLSLQCGTPLCRQVRTIFSEKGGFAYW